MKRLVLALTLLSACNRNESAQEQRAGRRYRGGLAHLCR